MKNLLVDRRDELGLAPSAPPLRAADRRELEHMIDQGVKDLDQAKRLLKALAWALVQLGR